MIVTKPFISSIAYQLPYNGVMQSFQKSMRVISTINVILIHNFYLTGFVLVDAKKLIK